MPPLSPLSAPYTYIDVDRDLVRFCESIAEAQAICLDTEFVSEDTYRPDLCLVQAAADGALAIIDPRRVDLRPFWERLASGGHETVVHAGREEFRFCLQAVGGRPQRLFDTQIAAGFVGFEYPASYGKLLSKLLGRSLPKGETRTEWRRRPLSNRQIEYALEDVMYLSQVHALLKQRLTQARRLEWFQDEMERWQAELEAFDDREHWLRLPGISGLSGQSLAVARELWRWREQKANLSNRPPRTVLRDDLLVELARRAKPGLRQVKAVRGIERSSARRHLPEIARCVERALELAPVQWPGRRSAPIGSSHGTVLNQFLTSALAAICQAQQLAPGLVGTAQDVRDYVAFRLNPPGGSPASLPRLAQGWRAGVIGKTLDELLAGKVGLTVRDPRADNPLEFQSSTMA